MADERRLDEVQEIFHRWPGILRDRSVASLVETITLQQRLPGRLLARGDGERFLKLVGSRLYLDRYWRYEQRVTAALRARSVPAPGVDVAVLRAELDRLLPREPGPQRPDWQRLAAAAAVLRSFAVILSGGDSCPGARDARGRDRRGAPRRRPAHPAGLRPA